MNQTTILQQHQQLCDEIHECVLDENRFLRQHQRSPDEALLARKRALLDKLDQSLAALRALPATSARGTALQAGLEKTRARILQILQLDKENEQLLLRCSLSRPATAADAPAKPVVPAAAMLQKIYSRCS